MIMSAISARIPIHPAPGHTHAQSASEAVGTTDRLSTSIWASSALVQPRRPPLSPLADARLSLNFQRQRAERAHQDSIIRFPAGAETPGTQSSRAERHSADAAGKGLRTSSA